METPGERLRKDRTAANLTADELGRRAAMVLARAKPIAGSTVRAHENGTGAVPVKVAEAYGRVLRTDPLRYLPLDKATKGSTIQQTGRVLRQVPVIGEVRAGVFQAVPSHIEQWDEQLVEEYVPFDAPQFDRATLVAYRVVGRSMDREYAEGTRVVVCPAAEIGVREGNHVIVSRPGRDGMELTIKEVRLEPGGVIALWPKSTDPAYQSPIRIQPNQDADSGPQIIGVVVAMHKVLPSPQGPLIQLP